MLTRAAATKDILLPFLSLPGPSIPTSHQFTTLLPAHPRTDQKYVQTSSRGIATTIASSDSSEPSIEPAVRLVLSETMAARDDTSSTLVEKLVLALNGRRYEVEKLVLALNGRPP